MATKYDSSVNVLGSIPDYSSMIDFICEYCGRAPEGQGSFSFRTHKTFSRFLAAIKTAILQFASGAHRELFLEALSSREFSFQEKLMVLYWQIVYANPLFHRISEEVFMKAVYQGTNHTFCHRRIGSSPSHQGDGTGRVHLVGGNLEDLCFQVSYYSQEIKSC